MSTIDKVVYRTTSPRAAEVMVALEAQRKAVLERRKKWLADFEAAHELAPWDHPPGRGVFLRGEEMLGVEWSSKDGKPPFGWRKERHTGALVPNLHTRAGKDILATLRELNAPDVLTTLQAELGVQSMIWMAHHFYQPGINFDEATGTLHIIWCRKAYDRIEFESRDGVEWTRIPLSEYYAFLESREIQ